MRPFRFSIVIATVALGAACGGASTPTTPAAITSVRVHVEPALSERLLPQVEGFFAQRGVAFEQVSPNDADLVITSEPDAAATAVTTRYWVPVATLSTFADDVPLAAIEALIADRATTWSLDPEAGLEPSLLVPDDPAAPLAQWSTPAAAGALAMPLESIARALAEDPGAIALLPLEAVDARVRSLSVDGENAVFDAGASHPLAEQAFVRPRDGDAQLEALASELAADLSAQPPEVTLLRATGDIIPARCVYAKHLQYGDPAHAFRELGPWLAEADITVGSLDAAISDAGPPFECVETFSLLAPASAIEGLELAGFDVITVATNHVKDCGQAACGDQAFFETLENLRGAGIAPVGGGADLAAARAPGIVEAGGVRFAFLGYDEIAPYYHAAEGVPGTAPLLEQYVRDDVAAARAIADVVIVLPQWGVEYTADPTLGQRALARAAVEAGAGLVVGNHPHWVQAAEVIDRTYVAYALGNFVFDQDWSVPTQQGVVLEAAFHGVELKGVRYYPIRIVDEHQPVFAEPAEAREILDRIWTASAALE